MQRKNTYTNKNKDKFIVDGPGISLNKAPPWVSYGVSWYEYCGDVDITDRAIKDLYCSSRYPGGPHVGPMSLVIWEHSYEKNNQNRIVLF